jgi:hypothetical protein
MLNCQSFFLFPQKIFSCLCLSHFYFRVTLETNEDGTPKSPQETWNDGKPKLYVHHNAFMKVLGATLDVDAKTMTPILYDREGFQMDPNA